MNSLQKFIQEYRVQDFPHSKTLFSALDKGEARLINERSDPMPCTALLKIYKQRALHLRSLGGQEKELLADVTTLCEELEKTPDELCQGWIFEMAPHYLFYVVEAVDSKRILGCSLGIDNRLVHSNDSEQARTKG